MRGEKVYSNPAVSDSGAGSWNCVSPTWMCGSQRQLAYLLHVPSLGSQETSVFCWRWSNPTNRAHMTGRTKFKCRTGETAHALRAFLAVSECPRDSKQTSLIPLPSTGLCGNCMYVVAKHPQVEVKALQNDPTCLGGHYFCCVVIIFHITHLSRN